ncbi:MAG: hypothetical protein ACK514_08260 [Bacteroidota bacterium]|jgi:hypothetical protein|nr:hypothetical protein [Cytophagales bacterium]MCA6428752.1 hypothetical protein [Cytophagales bacterium]MCE2958511.1 hypothetical protein [Flammeovirgaceae bacterium]MCZ8069525.1 hypothetical protein [Cytophagales bacterium]
MKKLSTALVMLFCVVHGHGQGLLNKVKAKAAQEVNKIENAATGNTNTASSNQNKLSANVTRTPITTLNQGEVFDYQESCIDLGSSLNQIEFVLRSGSKCFSFKNGTRAPIPCPSGGCASKPNCSYQVLRRVSADEEVNKYLVKEAGTPQQMPGLSAEQLKMMESMMTKEQIAEMKKSMAEGQKAMQESNFMLSINFAGKKYGPYKFIDFYLNSNNKIFCAVVGDESYNYKVISSVSAKSIDLKQNLPASPPLISPDGTEFGQVIINPQTQQSELLSASGKKYTVSGTYGNQKVWFTLGNHVANLSDTQLFLDGKAVKTFENAMNIEPCDVFVGTDGKSVTTIVENKILFADGDTYAYPMALGIYKEASGNFFKWLALEGKELVLYKKPN